MTKKGYMTKQPDISPVECLVFFVLKNIQKNRNLTLANFLNIEYNEVTK